ncbi:MAG: nucleoside triphosphate pyrophosphohydrolase [Deltaproteobacteria bacterium RBG_16_44_11]|nr:MAG: nucleoside triphosphate pyrophosphohydrolase [Deltaproteobacteria bacterium RBG_16_44_11]
MKNLKELTDLIKKLRASDGCPWDQKQTQKDLGKYILEEAYEVFDALEEKTPQAIKEELGDLLFQILFLTEINEEEGLFSLSDVVAEIRKKMIRRHPHVFGDKKVISVQEVKENWQKIKKMERKNNSNQNDLFAHVPRILPALKRAQKITAIAATYGFDWPKTNDVWEKIQEEIKEFAAALKSGNRDKIEEELGDILFTLVNLSRFVRVDAETALMKTTNKFLRRFSYIEKQLAARGRSLEETDLAEMDELWKKAKEMRI